MKKLSFKSAMSALPLVAILRGVQAYEVIAIAQVLKDAGFKIIEVPLNSPNPYASIKLLNEHFGDELIVGAGTVLSCEQVDLVKQAGGEIIIAPNVDTQVIRYAKQLGLYCVPGFYTPSEAFSALAAGADAIKMFPADTLGAKGLKAMMAVIPKDTLVLPVGGVSAQTMGDFLAAGAQGFGLGSGLYQAGMHKDEVATRAKGYVEAYQNAMEHA